MRTLIATACGPSMTCSLTAETSSATARAEIVQRAAVRNSFVRARMMLVLNSLLVLTSGSRNDVLGKLRRRRAMHHGIGILDSGAVSAKVGPHNVHHGVVRLLRRPITLPFEHDG